MKNILVVFDYSGTLSLKAPIFACPDNLLRELEQTGLTALGITTPSIFWEDIVNPSWQEGSTTQAGYKKVMEDRIRERMGRNSITFDETVISAAVCRFVDDYMSRSPIDDHWRGILSLLQDTPCTRTVIATDHYAEATEAIITHLKDLGIKAVRLRDALTKSVEKPAFMVANSADIGAHKSDRVFWTVIRNALGTDQFQNIVLVDDFGFNERTEDAYGDRETVKKRQQSTVNLVQEVFSGKVITIPFIAEVPDGGAFKLHSIDIDQQFGPLIERSSAMIADDLKKSVL
ncbi:MAG: hypothetical protein JW943_15755 [Deltaproteobacteria bacterium]|nr:hypothetical protein [Deltaproteobacteria bacterium]